MSVEMDQDRLFSDGTKINDWKVKDLLGIGGYGQVYKVTRHGTDRALKCDSKQEPNVKWETIFLKHITEHNLNHCLRIIDAGTFQGRDYVVMELMRKDIRSMSKDMLLTTDDSFALQVGIQTLQGIYQLHQIGILHRDLKPENLGVCSNRKNTVQIVDFNMSRFYTKKDGSLKLPRGKPGMRGTKMFLSFNAIQGREAGGVDELWSWFYILCELMRAHLPWDYSAHSDDPRNAVMRSTMFPASYLIGDSPDQLYSIYFHLMTLNFETCPDYRFLMKQIDELLCDKKAKAISFEKFRLKCFVWY